LHDIASAIAEIDDQGFTIIRDLITGDRLEKLQADAECLLHPIEAKCVDGGKVAGRMHKGTFAASRAFDDIIVHPTLLAIVHGVLDESRADEYPHKQEMDAYLASEPSADPGLRFGMMIKDAAPREDVRALHRDLKTPVPYPHRPLMCNSLLALDPFTEGNGATCVVPGSHKWDRPVEADAETIPVLMDPGSIVIFNGALWHGHIPNYSHDRYRRCLNLNYYYRRISYYAPPPVAPEVWQQLPEALQEMV
jgi:ectoine hydroxylase-related dioxygenase (phytanoyl-CoA dioxygenase family)